MTKYFKATVLENTALNKHFRLLTIDAGRSTLNAQRMPSPGQFYMLHSSDTYDPLLKRPFSILKCEDNTLKFLYRVRGKGTSCLSNLRKGDIIEVIGPLGNSYPEPDGDFIAVAGGVGIASLLSLLEKRKNTGYLFYGARSKNELVMLSEVEALAKEVFVATDDGSEGKKGLITELLIDFLNSTQPPPFPPLLKGGEGGLPIYACGPKPMLKKLSKIARESGIKCYVSLEEHMACGIGACLGCVVRTASGYRRVCKEGPVFDIKDIVWNNGTRE
ncbi:MAG: dihydroorotate dehydrogenase electron transfer subunit [Nitrospirae bacterium]|nr:dihydroorotate dehydrogenase electron transfer subunit [Nitrospirota bacterium]